MLAVKNALRKGEVFWANALLQNGVTGLHSQEFLCVGPYEAIPEIKKAE